MARTERHRERGATGSRTGHLFTNICAAPSPATHTRTHMGIVKSHTHIHTRTHARTHAHAQAQTQAQTRTHTWKLSSSDSVPRMSATSPPARVASVCRAVPPPPPLAPRAFVHARRTRTMHARTRTMHARAYMHEYFLRTYARTHARTDTRMHTRTTHTRTHARTHGCTHGHAQHTHARVRARTSEATVLSKKKQSSTSSAGSGSESTNRCSHVLLARSCVWPVTRDRSQPASRLSVCLSVLSRRTCTS